MDRAFVQPGNVKNPGAALTLFEVPLVPQIPDYLAPEFSTFLGLLGIYFTLSGRHSFDFVMPLTFDDPLSDPRLPAVLVFQIRQNP